MFHERALPDLGNNIKCGNSLIGTDFYNTPLSPLFRGEKMDSPLARGAGGVLDEERHKVNPFDWETEYPEIIKNGGFDAVIGNPPYISVESTIKDITEHYLKNFKSAYGRANSFSLFIEQNPVQAKIVEKAEDYPCSSAKAHIHGVKDKILGEALFEGGQMEDYIELMKASIKEEEINNIRNHTRSGRPIGSESFIKKMERKLDRIFKLRSRGRPNNKNRVTP